MARVRYLSTLVQINTTEMDTTQYEEYLKVTNSWQFMFDLITTACIRIKIKFAGGVKVCLPGAK